MPSSMTCVCHGLLPRDRAPILSQVDSNGLRLVSVTDDGDHPSDHDQSVLHAYAYLHKRCRWMRYQAYRCQHLPIGSGITEAACKIVFTQRLKRSGMVWTQEGGQVILDLWMIWLSGAWDAVH
jgi:hypothetical protein